MELHGNQPLPSVAITSAKDNLRSTQGNRRIVLDHPNPQQHMATLKQLVFTNTKTVSQSSVEAVKAQIDQIKGSAKSLLKSSYDQVVDKLKYVPDDKLLQQTKTELKALMDEGNRSNQIESVSYAQDFSSRVGKKLMELSTTQLNWRGGVNFFSSLYDSMKSIGSMIVGNPPAWAIVRDPEKLLAAAKKASAPALPKNSPSLSKMTPLSAKDRTIKPPLPSLKSKLKAVAALRSQIAAGTAQGSSLKPVPQIVTPPLQDAIVKGSGENSSAKATAHEPTPEELMQEFESEELLSSDPPVELIREKQAVRAPNLFSGDGASALDRRLTSSSENPTIAPTATPVTTPKRKKSTAKPVPIKAEPIATRSAPKPPPKLPSNPQEWDAFYNSVENMGSAAKMAPAEAEDTARKGATPSVSKKSAPPPVTEKSAEEMEAEEILKDLDDLNWTP